MGLFLNPITMAYKIFLVGKKAVRVLQRFDNSWLIEYVVSGVQVSINPQLVKSKTVHNQTTKKKPVVNKQTKFKF